MDTYSKIKAFDMFCGQVEQAIENNIPRWKEENPYWEIDGDDGRPAHCPPTTDADAREDLCSELIAKAEDLGFGDFFELVLHEVYGEAMSRTNEFRAVFESQTQKKEQDAAIDALIKGQQKILDALFFPSIKPEGSKNA